LVDLRKLGHLSYASEADIANYVNMVLRDTIHAMGRSDDIMLYAAMGFCNQRPDIWVICCNGLPVGFIEIKKPSGAIMDEPLLAGQVFDYLMLLKSFYGIEFQFGIVSTYELWQFFWLHKTDPAAQMNTVSKPQSVSNPGQSPLVICLPGIPCFDKKNKTSIQVIGQSSHAQKSYQKREVFASDVFSSTNKNLPRAIASILSKMAASPRQKVNLADSTRSYIKMTENSWNWVTLPTNLQVIKFGNLPRNDTKNFICLSYLGSGAEGLV